MPVVNWERCSPSLGEQVQLEAVLTLRSGGHGNSSHTTQSLIYLTRLVSYVAITNSKLGLSNIFRIGHANGGVTTYCTSGSEITLSDANVYEFYANSRRAVTYPLEMITRWFYKGYLAPENNVAAGVGTLYMRRTNGYLYSKQSGTGNTGWIQIT